MAEGTGTAGAAPGDMRVRLLAASFLMLFVELALIRWSSAFILYLAYFTNFVLLASFLGIGLGFLRAGSERNLLRLAPAALTGLTAFVLIFPVQVNYAHGRGVSGLLGMFALPIWVTLPVIFLGATFAMACIAQGVARAFMTFKPLDAYRLDVLGSLLGIGAFSAMSFFHAPPVWWALVIAAILYWLIRPDPGRSWRAFLVAVVLVMAAGSFLPGDQWSPYYRVTRSDPTSQGSIGIKVNGLPHQSIVPLDLLKQEQPFYLFPYRHLKDNPLNDVLIIGAGNGNDVAVALSMGAKHIDAVEIDPVIQSIGRDLHPAHPYQDPRVTAYINDGRAFLHQTDTKYDLIILALPDSLTLVSGQSSLRLESYLFTLQAFQEVRAHLQPGGVFSLYNYYSPAVFSRLANTLAIAFGHLPCVDQGTDMNTLGYRQEAVLTTGLTPASIACTTPWVATAAAPAPSTDDRPFPYLFGHSIPRFYANTLLLILAASLLLVRLGSGRRFREMLPYVDLFFMGAAFLLLETKNVVQFALLFGTTWFVNSLVFAGILLAVYLAVEIARRGRLPGRLILYAILLATLAVAWLVPPARLLGLAAAPRFLAASAIGFGPVFVANLIFAQRFSATASSVVAFGTNLLGAMVGGLLEYSALVIGYRSLLIVVAALYGLACLTSPRRTRTEPTTVAEVIEAAEAVPGEP